MATSQELLALKPSDEKFRAFSLTNVSDSEWMAAMDRVEHTVSRLSNGVQRALNLIHFCRENNVPVDSERVTIEEHTDWRWKGPKPLIAKREIGSYTKGKYCKERYWAVLQ